MNKLFDYVPKNKERVGADRIWCGLFMPRFQSNFAVRQKLWQWSEWISCGGTRRPKLSEHATKKNIFLRSLAHVVGETFPSRHAKTIQGALIWITNHSRRTALQYRPRFCLDSWVTPFAGWRHWSILWKAHPPDQRNCRLKRLIKPVNAEWVHYSSSCVHYVALGLLWCRPRCGHFCMQPLSIIPLMFPARILTCQGCQGFRPVFESNWRWKSNFKRGFYAKGGKMIRAAGDPEWDVKTPLKTTALMFVMLRISGYQG